MFLLRDFLAMLRDLRRHAPGVDKWGAALNLPQIVGGLWFIGTLQGQCVLAANILSLIVASQIHKRRPFSRLAGICHAPWLALLPYLALSLPDAALATPLRLWLLYVAVTMAISLALDARDVFRYFATADKTYVKV